MLRGCLIFVEKPSGFLRTSDFFSGLIICSKASLLTLRMIESSLERCSVAVLVPLLGSRKKDYIVGILRSALDTHCCQ